MGLERAGMICKWQVEIDPFCQQVLAKHWPDVKRYSDVRECGSHNLEPVDVICGGFPCQPHSVAGQRRGASDDRDLWPEYRRIIEELKPAYIIGENVPGIITTILDQVLSDLEHLEYSCQPFIIPACGFDAPHKRDRVFIVAHSNAAQRWPQFTEGKRNQGGDDSDSLQRWQEISSGFGAGGQTRLMGDSSGKGLEKWESQRINTSKEQQAIIGASRKIGEWWTVEPGVGRVANGVPNRVDRLRALGNAVVPQVAEFIGRELMKHIVHVSPM